MEAAIEIPIPLPGDSDTVVSSLETAAVFGAKGDVTEALRWLQRAAESAGDGTDDARTLSLAQTLASLKSRVENGAGSDQTLEKATAAASASNGHHGEDERPFLLESRAIRASTPPPPPSARARSSNGSPSPTPANPAMPSPATASPATPSSAAATAKVPAFRPPTAEARAAATATPSVSKPAAPVATARPPARMTPSSGTAMPASVRQSPSVTPAPPGMRPASKSVTPSVLGAPPAAAVAQARHAHLNGEGTSEGAGTLADTGASTRRARQAARVSITRSLTERGLYFVRVLDEGQAPADDACEGLLVSSDPNITLV